jgi:RNA-directed DNA polymerase
MDDVLGEVRMESVVASENMRNAWAQVKRNRGAPGIDRRTIAATQAWLRIHYATVRESLLNGTYEPQPVRRAQIAKRSGGTRDLGIPTVLDRVIQQAIAQVLTPIFDVGFSASSFGFRPGRSAHGALRQMQSYVRRGYRIAVDMDVEKFFDRVNHDVLMARVARKVTDKRMLGVIGRFLRAGVWVEGEVQPSEMGTPQGGPLSPLLANILLDDLDKELERRGHLFARYADDLLIVVRSARAGERVMASVQRYLGRVLRLQVNAQKSRVGPIDACPFLGFHIVKGKLRWSARAFADFKHRIRKLTGRSWGVSMEARLRRLREYLQGWMGYFGITEYYRPIPELDSWLRRRVRMCYWKQWRKPRTRIGHLLAMGTSREHAIRTGLSRKGYWHLAKTLATQTGMTNEWLSTQGLASIRALWMRVHGYAD